MNATFASDISCLQAEISQLQLTAEPTLEQQRAKLVYSAAVKSFRQLADSSSSSIGYSLPNPSNFWLATQVWQERYPGVRHWRVVLLWPAITVESGLRHAGPMGPWIGGVHTTSRSKTIFGITRGVWNAPTWSWAGAIHLDYDSDSWPVLPDRDRGRASARTCGPVVGPCYWWLGHMCSHGYGHEPHSFFFNPIRIDVLFSKHFILVW